MSLITSLNNAIRTKRGQRAIRLRRGWGPIESFMCKRCGLVIHWSDPKEYGCPRCDMNALIESGEGRQFWTYWEVPRPVGIDHDRVCRAMIYHARMK